MVALRVADLQGSHESLFALLVLNLHSPTLVCLFVAYLIARSFLVRGTPGLLLLGCGVVIWGPAGVVAAAAARGDANTSIIIYNGCVWLSGLCHLVGVSLTLRPRRSLSVPALWLPGAYVLAAGAVMLVTLSALAGWIPTFFVEERGGTLVRQVVLVSAVAMFALTALLLRVTSRQPMSAFVYWYALALLLIATGLFGVLLQTHHASILGWTGRVTQSLGGLYMLVAAIVSVRESRVWGISLEEALQQSEERYRTLVETAPDAIVVHRDGRLLYANSETLSLVGADSFEQLARHTVPDFFRPAERERITERMLRAMGGDKLPVREGTLLRLDGKEVTAEFHTAPVDFQGARAVLTIIRDITERKRAEAALRENQALVHAVVDGSPDLIYVKDIHGRVLMANPPACEALGRPAEQVIGQTACEFHRDDPDVGRAIVENDRRIMESGRTETIEELGSKGRIFLSTKAPYRDADDKVMGLIGISHDITERKRAEEALRASESRYRRLFEAAPFGIGTADLAGHILSANPAMEEIMGYRFEELLALGVERVYANPSVRQEVLREIRRQGRVRDREVDLKRKDGSICHALLNIEQISLGDGQPPVLLTNLRDITDRKQAEEALRELNATLESKVVQRTAELEHRARQLQRLTLELAQAEERERRRIAVILHEDLQQQIAGAKFHLNLIRGRAKDNRVRADIEGVDAMLKEAIEKSRSLSRDLSPAVVHMNDLAEVLQWLANQVRAQQGLSVHVDFRGDMMLQSEALATFLFRAAQEMLLNVVKHARVREAAIHIRRLRHYVCLCVIDQGCGFDLRALKETSGVGLFSIRERTELLGGRMRARSTEGQGSRFRLVVPDNLKGKNENMVVQGVPGNGVLSSRVSPAVASGALRVLLVDDHEIVRQGLASLLREASGIELVGEAPDGREAINLALDLQPDVVIMDVSMPLISGDQATQQIKAYLPKTRVIALSMYDEADKKQKMFEAGAEAYILKTVSAEELLAAIRGRESDWQPSSRGLAL
jgi:PAS domain S-box-containing protein